MDKEFACPITVIPMFCGRDLRVTEPETNIAVKRKADEEVAGDRCLHCNKAFGEDDEKVHVREGVSDAQVHSRCHKDFKGTKVLWDVNDQKDSFCPEVYIEERGEVFVRGVIRAGAR